MREVPLEEFFDQMDALLARGATGFKFIDRTFNLSIPFALRVLDFFHARLRPGLSLHFEMVPERLPPELLEALARFPEGVIQLEVGVQTFDKSIAKRISRPLKIKPLRENIAALRNQTSVHLHVDLIAGLPGEDLASFAAGFDQLHALNPHEIQLGILKRLKGTPMTRHTDAFGMVYSDEPPLKSFRQVVWKFLLKLQELKRIARFWDLVATTVRLSGYKPFDLGPISHQYLAFREFSRWLYQTTDRTSHISLLKLAEYLLDFLIEARGLSEQIIGPVVVADLAEPVGDASHVGCKSIIILPRFAAGGL